MHLASIRAINSRFPGRLSAACAALFLSMGALAVSAQSNRGGDPTPPEPGRSGKYIIQGLIQYPDGRTLDRPIGVKLSSAAGGDQLTMSRDGVFIFRGLRGGTYHLSADAGQEYELVSEKVDIIEPSGQQVIALQISLRPKARAERMIGTVDASLAGVPEAALKLYDKALESAQAGKREKAIEELRKAISIHPDFMPALNELGVQYLRLRQFEKAREALLSALKLAPDAFAPRLNYGIALLQMKDYAGAVTELGRARKKDDASAGAHLHLGRALIGLGKYDEAEKALRRALALGGDEVVEAHRFLAAVYIEKRENARAAAELETYLTLAPDVKDRNQIRKVISDLLK